MRENFRPFSTIPPMTREREFFLTELARRPKALGEPSEAGVLMERNFIIAYKVKLLFADGKMVEVNPPPCGEHNKPRHYDPKTGIEVWPNDGTKESGRKFLVPLDAAFLRRLACDDLRARMKDYDLWHTVPDHKLEAVMMILGILPENHPC